VIHVTFWETIVRIAYSVCACKSIIFYRNIAAAHARISPVNHFGKSSWEFFFLDNSFARVRAGHFFPFSHGTGILCGRLTSTTAGVVARWRYFLSHRCLTVCLLELLELCCLGNLPFKSLMNTLADTRALVISKLTSFSLSFHTIKKPTFLY